MREARLVKYENLMQCLKSILLQFRIGRFRGAQGAPAHAATRQWGREEAAEVQCGLFGLPSGKCELREGRHTHIRQRADAGNHGTGA